MDQDRHVKFTAWCKEQGIQIVGVEPKQFLAKGLGIVATQHIRKGQDVVTVPAKCLVTVDHPSIKAASKKLQGLSVHGKLALALTGRAVEIENSVLSEQWRDAMPRASELEESMPFCWPDIYQDLLASPAKVLLEKQKIKLEADLAAALPLLFPPDPATDVSRLYTAYWLLVNTRCFYWDYPNRPGGARLAKKKLPRDDCMALCPFVDYFNHANSGCEVTYSTTGFRVVADRDYRPGEEVSVSYGAHSNDFLLVEYGFTFPENTSDSLNLDTHIIPRLSGSQRNLLADENLLSNYTLHYVQDETHKTVTCHRTQCALRAMLLPPRRWARFVSGENDGEKEQGDVDDLAGEVMKGCLADVRETLGRVKAMSAGEKEECCRRAVEMRCKQMETMLAQALGSVPKEEDE